MLVHRVLLNTRFHPLRHWRKTQTKAKYYLTNNYHTFVPVGKVNRRNVEFLIDGKSRNVG